MLHKILFAAVAAATVFAMTGCGLFQSAYPEKFPAEWKEKEMLSQSVRELAPGLTAYQYHFKDFREGTPLSLNLVVADWKKTGGKLAFKVDATLAKKLPVAAGFSSISNIFCVAAGTDTDPAGKPLTALKTADGKIHEPAQAKNRIKGYSLLSSRNFFPMIKKSAPLYFADPMYENVIQGLLLAENGRSIFSRPISGAGAYTVIGLDQESQRMILLVVDGYHQNASPGVSLSDIPEIMFALGAKDVLCINAGPSGSLALAGENGLDIVSYPSGNGVFDHAGAREVQNRVVFCIVKDSDVK